MWTAPRARNPLPFEKKKTPKEKEDKKKLRRINEPEILQKIVGILKPLENGRSRLIEHVIGYHTTSN